LLLITVSHLTSYRWDMASLRLNLWFLWSKSFVGKVSLTGEVGI